MINTTEDNKSNEKNEQRRRRVNTIKTVIIALMLIFMIFPSVCCVYLGVRLIKLQQQVNRLILYFPDEEALDDKGTGSIAYAAEKEKDIPDKATTAPLTSPEEPTNPDDSYDTSEAVAEGSGDVFTKPAVTNKDALAEDKADKTDNEADPHKGAVNIDSKSPQLNMQEGAGSGSFADKGNANGHSSPEPVTVQLPDTSRADIQADNMADASANKEDIPAAGKKDDIQAEGRKDTPAKGNKKDKPADTADEASAKDATAKDASAQKRFAGKKVYITFDDGPSIHTGDILDILKEYGVKATFFVVGKTDSYSKSMYKRIVDEGHTLGMHSYSHKYDQIYNSVEDFDKDFTKLWNLLYDTTGLEPKIYRFPGGSANKVSKNGMEEFVKYLNEKSIVYFDWNVLSGDATDIKYTDEQLIENVLKGVEAKKRSIVLLHDTASKEATVRTLPVILEELLTQGAELYPLDPGVKPIQMIKSGFS